MKTSDIRFLKTWPRERLLGKRRFILLRGLLAWGLPCAIIVGGVLSTHVAGEFSPIRPLATAFGCLVLSVCYGAWLWARSEQRYTNLSAKHETAASYEGSSVKR